MELETEGLTLAADGQTSYLQQRGQPRSLTEIAALSQAISLKRIADTLERFQAKLEAEEAKDRGPTSVDDAPAGNR